MTNETVAVLCGTCKCSAEIISDSKGDRYAVCPTCDQRDNLDDALEIVQEHVGHAASQRLHSGLTKALRGSKSIKLRSEAPSNRDFRWVANLDL